MNTPMIGRLNEQKNEISKPPIPCWFCGELMSMAKVMEKGIILAREAARGGPRRLLLCPACLKENLCEETRKGRWFASPNVTLGVLDILFSQVPGATTEEVLQAISWFRENEEKRRYFFLRDGDDRYMGSAISFLRKLWPWGEPEPDVSGSSRPATETGDGKGKRRRERAGARTSSATGGSSSGSTRSAGGRESREPHPSRPRIVTPHEMLGLAPGSSGEEIRRAFHRLAVKYHPDKVHHLGEEFQAMAHLKFQELMRAYEALTQKRG